MNGQSAVKFAPGAFQRQIAANDIHDVAGGTNRFESVFGNQPSHARSLTYARAVRANLLPSV